MLQEPVFSSIYIWEQKKQWQDIWVIGWGNQVENEVGILTGNRVVVIQVFENQVRVGVKVHIYILFLLLIVVDCLWCIKMFLELRNFYKDFVWMI